MDRRRAESIFLSSKESRIKLWSMAKEKIHFQYSLLMLKAFIKKHTNRSLKDESPSEDVFMLVRKVNLDPSNERFSRL